MHTASNKFSHVVGIQEIHWIEILVKCLKISLREITNKQQELV